MIWRILFCVFILQFVIHKYFRLSNVLVKPLFCQLSLFWNAFTGVIVFRQFGRNKKRQE
jgi:hypothetical protein